MTRSTRAFTLPRKTALSAVRRRGDCTTAWEQKDEDANEPGQEFNLRADNVRPCLISSAYKITHTHTRACQNARLKDVILTKGLACLQRNNCVFLFCSWLIWKGLHGENL